MDSELKLEDLGYDDFFETNRRELGLGGFLVARVVAEYRGVYRVKGLGGEYMAKITGKQMFAAMSREDYPAVGDWVAITDFGEGRAVINKVLPRKTIIKRKISGRQNEIQVIGANIDVAFAVESVDSDFSLNRFERYSAITNDGGVKMAIILNKIDLISREELQSKVCQIKDRFDDIDIILTSTVTAAGLDELRKYIAKGRTYCFLGSSGVGKSSLINKLIGQKVIITKEIDLRTDRGRHTTTAREMHFLKNGGIVIDNPGMREVGMADAGAGIDNFFDEIVELGRQCKFADCAHANEPGCAVRAAIKAGKLDESKYDNYASLKKEADFFQASELEKRQKDRQFGKFLKTAKEQLKRNSHKNY
ncbi:MAG: ribosome small subunit-dependent GTPase A [Candidatus Paceibacterota bacterium]